MNNRLIPLTDGRGKKMLPDDELFEPNVDSIILTRGVHGQAWQRWATDGRWHTAGSRVPCDWATLLEDRDVLLVYEADHRPEPKPAPARVQVPVVNTWANGRGN